MDEEKRENMSREERYKREVAELTDTVKKHESQKESDENEIRRVSEQLRQAQSTAAKGKQANEESAALAKAKAEIDELQVSKRCLESQLEMEKIAL